MNMNEIEIYDEMYNEILKLVKFHSVDVPIIYGDGEEATDKMISLYELKLILEEIRGGIYGQ